MCGHMSTLWYMFKLVCSHYKWQQQYVFLYYEAKKHNCKCFEMEVNWRLYIFLYCVIILFSCDSYFQHVESASSKHKTWSIQIDLHETMVPKLLSMHRIAYTNSLFENRELKVAHVHKYFARSGLNKISTFKGQFNLGI